MLYPAARVKAALLEYTLPDASIARFPARSRSGARLLCLEDGACRHLMMDDFAEVVPEGALLVVNETRVRRARVFATRHPGGGRVELLFLSSGEPAADGRELWEALARSNRPLLPGAVLLAEGLEVEVFARRDEGILELLVRAPEPVESVLERRGHVPLPPYLKREEQVEDIERYQTVYARRTGSVAAPTAGLHLTEPLLSRLRDRGVALGRLDLEIGLGTFRPVKSEDLDQHAMHEERFEVDQVLAGQVSEARTRGRPVVAVGTTVVRALESAAVPDRPGVIRPSRATTRLLIQPGYRFSVVDALLTNFHQPRSTLLALVSAFAGHLEVMAAYAEALERGYRFLSYGDAMWIPRRRA